MHIKCQTILFSTLLTCLSVHGFDYENPEDYPLMGDWAGEWIGATKGHERVRPQIYAQLLPTWGNHYRVLLVPELYNRSEPYLDVNVPGSHEKVIVNHDSFEIVFEGNSVKGVGKLYGDPVHFTLTKQDFVPNTLGLQPPLGATVLFDGSSLDAWHHQPDQPATWEIIGDAVQVATKSDPQNKARGIGGNILTKEKFSSMRFHMEFRYPVEANRSGQNRGNSGLFFRGIGEVQILNSYTTAGYWNEAGAIYKRVPAKVNAAGPPLAWQTYDVELQLPEAGGQTAMMTVHLNGRLLHNKMEIPCSVTEVDIMLQDHSNPLQFRNIWLKEF
ncbi:3-keto-disaccharide hydrolase [Coraliomargarita akajimensis]|uniref:3-keto-alpha-glucoside-1,2-lyase/3-keto-2-hydroxy-glucal hydratase domain-containing protein n=1 Tax=Coraliomargarita akajimensis (strain DSM 45221 / IAM 15411 / JCM 23193 / KCTC 12865 / 04OKA010-24) TaxID=583355 RepID=D5EL17_CORAD|nr:DUF1080 domain-containing protein [Coraliomargarita akajimensis]ADE53119.1 protein of unknown function DUF1080 [Coraliomargarita akajimensis DSM 45221]